MTKVRRPACLWRLAYSRPDERRGAQYHRQRPADAQWAPRGQHRDAGESGTQASARLAGRLEWPLAAVALLFLAAYAWPILQPQLDKNWHQLCKAVVFGSWLVFISTT